MAEPEKQPDDPITVKSPVIVKSPLTVPDSSILLDLSIQILRIVELLKKEGENAPRIVNTLLTVLTSDYGPEVIKHLYEFQAYTYGELERTLGASKTALHYITNRLLSVKMVLMVDVGKPPGTKTPGPAPLVWLLRDAEPEKAGECIERHYRLFEAKKINLREIRELREAKKREALRIKIEEYVQAVLAYIGEWDKRLQTIDRALYDVGVPGELFGDIRKRVIDHYVELRRKEQIREAGSGVTA